MLYEVKYQASRVRTIVVSDGSLEEALLILEGHGIKILSVKERPMRRRIA